MSDLFLDDRLPLEFEKVSSPTKLSDNPDNWQKEIAAEVYKQAPFLADYSINVIIDKADPQRGYAFGAAEVTSQSDAPHGEKKKLPKIVVPLIVKDRLLAPLDVFMDGKSVFPLSEERAREHLMRTDAMELSTRKPQDQGMVDQLYPPLRTNYGYGNSVSTGTGVGGFGKVASLLDAIMPDVSPTQISQFVSAIGSDPSIAMAANRNEIFRKTAMAIAAYPAISAEKRAEALVDSIKPTVVQLLKLANGNFNVKWAAAGAFNPQEGEVGPADAANMAGSDRVVRMQPGEAITVSTDKAKKTTLEQEKLEQVRDFGCYRVQNADTKEHMVGWVIPIMDFEMQPLPLYIWTDGIQFSVQDNISGSRVNGSLDDFMALFGGDEPKMDVPPPDMPPPEAAPQGPPPGAPPAPGGMPKQASLATKMMLPGAALAGGVYLGRKSIQPRQQPMGKMAGLSYGAPITQAVGDAGVGSRPILRDGQHVGFVSGQGAPPNPGVFEHPYFKDKLVPAAQLQKAAADPAGAPPPQGPPPQAAPEPLPPPPEDPPPQGNGAFIHIENERAIALPPTTIKATTTSQEGEVSYHISDVWGEESTLHIAPGSQVVMEIGPGEYAIPETFKFLPLKDPPVHLVKDPMEMSKMAYAQEIPSIVEIRGSGSNNYSLSGYPVEFLSSDKTNFLKKAEAEFLLVTMGMNPFEAREKLAEASTCRYPVKVAGMNQIVPLSHLHREMTKKAAAVLRHIPNLRKNLIKEAAALEDGETVNNVLSMNFINPENIGAFAQHLPELDETAQKLAEMLVASRLGMSLVPEGALERSLKAIEEVIGGLKMVKQKVQA